MALSDDQLLSRISKGDRDAFSTFYDQHASRVLGFLVRLLRDRTEAEDVLQATFLQVWRTAARFEAARGTPAGWLRMIARSRALDALRRRRPGASTDGVPEPQAPDQAATTAEQDEVSGRVEQALAQLPPNQGQALRLAFYAGLTHAQVAGRMNVPLGTAKTWIRRGMVQMKSILDRRQEVSA